MLGLRDVIAADLSDLLALNNAHAVELSALDPTRLAELVRMAYSALTTPGREALLIAFAPGVAYDSPNFAWFCARFDRFVYVDRIVVAASSRGRGLARALYGDLFARAAEDGFSSVTCEVNIEPPNPASDAFHTSLGFAPVGQARLPSGKVVRYLAADLAVASSGSIVW